MALPVYSPQSFYRMDFPGNIGHYITWKKETARSFFPGEKKSIANQP
jgi:hypothetical protein